MNHDAIILGLGGMGSAALYELACRGFAVLGLEQFPLVHDRGSSHGQTRILRQAYYEHPAYVPLVQRSLERWFALEQLTGRHLFTPCACVNIGPAAGELVAGVRATARQHALAVEELSAADLAREYPMAIPEGFVGVREAGAGYLAVEECVRAHLDAARACGAQIHAEEPVLGWNAVGNSIEVRTATGTHRAAKLIITAGAWATRWLADLGVPLTVMRQVMLWFAPHESALFRRDRFPIFLVDAPGGAFYGLPMLDSRGMKIARHYGAPELASPDAVDWTVHAADEMPVRAFLDAVLPGRFGACTAGQVCMYTLTTDRHFVIDVHPRHPNVAVATGFSGHGFKFAAVVGEILADLATTGRTGLPVDLFRTDRF